MSYRPVDNERSVNCLGAAPKAWLRFLALNVALALSLAVACSGPSQVAPPAHATVIESTATVAATPEPSATPAPPPRRPDASPFPDDLAARARDTLAAIAALRGTPPPQAVDAFLLSRAQARAYYSTDNGGGQGSGAAPGLDAKNELYRLLGLIPDREQRNVGQATTDNLVSLITGFYAPELKAFYMLDEITGGVHGPSARATIAHEFVHALQDQYHDIEAQEAQRRDDWDAMRAFQQAMEGDALYFESKYLGYSARAAYRVPVCFQIPSPLRPSVPFVIERELDTWYEDGLCFVQDVLPLLSGGVSELWQRLPATTEQVLHPEKYLAAEPASPVTLECLESALGEGWSRLKQANLGEFGLQNLLVLGLTDRTRAGQAAAGWGGDAWALYTNAEGRLLYSVSVWDSPAEAREFWLAFRQSLAGRATLPIDPAGDSFSAETAGGRMWRAWLEDDRVSFFVANDVSALDRAAAAAGLR